MERLNLHNKYNEEPVYYCPHCMSLNIRDVAGTDYCEDCGSVDIKQSDIYSWEKMYEDKYGHKLVNIK